MITTKTVKIDRVNNPTSEYIEGKLKQQGLDVLRWAITDYDEKSLIISVAVIYK